MSAVPTNAELAERAKGKTAREVVRGWLERHVPDVRYQPWLYWAADNFLADPEIAQHFRPVTDEAAADLIERVAEALWAAIHPNFLWSAAGMNGQDDYRRIAAAAVEVLRGETR